MISNGKLYLAVFVLLAARTGLAQDAFFQEGRTEWKIYLSVQADPTEAHAAQELRDALKKISGAAFEVLTSEKPPDSRAIIIGDLRNPEVQSRAAVLNLGPGKVEEVAVYRLGDRLYLAGNQPRGALYAVYSFLQRELGVRWLWPGDDGEFMPPKTTWTLPEVTFNHTPAIAYRGFHLCGTRDAENVRRWMARNFVNIHRDGTPPEEKPWGFYSLWSSHRARLPSELFDRHPEYFAEINGKRYKSNMCFSNPEVDELVAASLADYVRKHPYIDMMSFFPDDNQDYCRCALCARKDVPTAWFDCFNRLTDLLKHDLPSVKFTTIAYQGYREVPKCKIRNCEFVEYASIGRCFTHPFGEAGCTQNEDALRTMLAWKATGLPIGHYAYEFDVFRKNGRMLPFLSVIDDVVKTSKRLGLTTLMPEVSLMLEKDRPEVYARNVQNRLPIYLYARLLWNPDQKMTDVVEDWCRTVFGNAAESMLDYYLRMDRAWMSMPTHTRILGDAASVAPLLMTDKVQKEALLAFTAATARLPEISEPAVRERAAAAIEREKVLFQQWMDLCQIQADGLRLSLPLLAQAADVAQSSCRPQEFAATARDTRGSSTRVRLAWTKKTLLVNWVCQDPHIRNLKAEASDRDGKVVEDDSVELSLSSGLGGQTWHFAVNSRGTLQDYRISEAGVREDLWNPEWQAGSRVGANSWEVEMTIPFASLGAAPNPNESWQAHFLRHNGGRADFAEAAFPSRESALLLFSSAARTDRSLLWWSGAPERESAKDSVLIQDFTESGWEFHVVTTGQELAALHDRCDAYWFRHPNGPNKVPAEYWARYLAPAVRGGALAVFSSYMSVPLEQYFQDPSLKVKMVQSGKVPASARRVDFLAPGTWTTKPNDLLHALKNDMAPAYGFVPADTAAWKVLSTAPSENNQSFPYLLAKPYGKGLIILCGDRITLPPAQMLENLILYCQSEFKLGELMPRKPAPHSGPVATHPKQPALPAKPTPKSATQSGPIKRPEPAVRTWTDQTGQYRVEAEFLGLAAGQVKLKKPGGETVAVPLERLSDEDREWIRKRVR